MTGTALGGIGSSALATVTAPDSVTLVVEGRPERVPVASSDETVGDVLRSARVAPRWGHLRSARTGAVLASGAVAPTYALDGASVLPESPIRGARRLEVRAGTDEVEATVERDGPAVPPPAPPAVEYALWHPGVPGRTRLVVGSLSGEVVATEVEPATPPSPVTEKVVALTFDDGPWPDTPDFLRVLHDGGVRATFCLIGRQIPAMLDAVHQVAAAGMTLCNHTVDHNMYLDRALPDVVRSDVNGGRDAISVAVGHAPAFYRPPGGTLSPEIVASAQRAGEQVIHWTVDSMDYRHLSADAITQRVVSLVTPGAIVLMHDGGGDRSQTLSALPRIIDQLHALGYVFATPDGIGATQKRPEAPLPYLHTGSI
ncbi:MAG: hypothetical protein NVS1B12_03340 [Acidimicrobiales bacterium]